MGRKERYEDSLVHLPILISIMQTYLGHTDIRQSTPEEDKIQATDLVAASTIRIACKVRDESCKEYGDFALRSEAADGALASEWDKVMSGFGDLLLYCFENEAGEVIWWQVIDLCVLRRAKRNLWIGCEKPRRYDNDAKDVHIWKVPLKGISERYGRILIAEGPAPIDIGLLGDGIIPC